MVKLTKNFSKSEFECKCGCSMPEPVFHNIQKLANQLQMVRNFVETPITLTNAYRCPEHNAAIGSKPTSQHILGKAADIKIKKKSPEQVQIIIEAMIDHGQILQGGLGLYNTFVHYDIRKTRARWDNSDK